MNSLDHMASQIIKEQEMVIGPLAWTEAEKVKGLQIVDRLHGGVVLSNGDPKEVIDRLVEQYEHLFGRASREVCREAVAGMLTGLSPSDIPSSLRV